MLRHKALPGVFFLFFCCVALPTNIAGRQVR